MIRRGCQVGLDPGHPGGASVPDAGVRVPGLGQIGFGLGEAAETCMILGPEEKEIAERVCSGDRSAETSPGAGGLSVVSAAPARTCQFPDRLIQSGESLLRLVSVHQCLEKSPSRGRGRDRRPTGPLLKKPDRFGDLLGRPSARK